MYPENWHFSSRFVLKTTKTQFSVFSTEILWRTFRLKDLRVYNGLEFYWDIAEAVPLFLCVLHKTFLYLHYLSRFQKVQNMQKKCKNKKIGKIIILSQSVLFRFCLPLKGLFQKSLPFYSTPRTTDTWWLNS